MLDLLDLLAFVLPLGDSFAAAAAIGAGQAITGWQRLRILLVFVIFEGGMPFIVAIAIQVSIAAQLGLAIGAKIGERWRERSE